MSSSRRLRRLTLIVVVLSAILGIKLLRASGHSEPPWQLPVSHSHTSAAVNGTGEDNSSHEPKSEPRYAHAVLDLLPLTIPRSSDNVAVAQVGPRWLGTDNEEAARLLDEARQAIGVKQAAMALELARRGLELDPDFPQLLVTAASAALACEDADLPEARLLARLAVVRAPMYPEAHYNLACALARQGRAADAAASLADAKSWGNVRNLDVLGAARNDPDFDGVRESPEIQALLQKQ